MIGYLKEEPCSEVLYSLWIEDSQIVINCLWLPWLPIVSPTNHIVGEYREFKVRGIF